MYSGTAAGIGKGGDGSTLGSSTTFDSGKVKSMARVFFVSKQLRISFCNLVFLLRSAEEHPFATRDTLYLAQMRDGRIALAGLRYCDFNTAALSFVISGDIT